MKLTRNQKAALRKVRDQGPLYVDLADEEASFILCASNAPMRRDLARRLIGMGALEPRGDGLFGDTQTYAVPAFLAALLTCSP